GPLVPEDCMLGPPAASPSPYVAIVRRGQGMLFVTLDTCIAESGMQVVWARRVGERRRARADRPSCERRAGDRRSPPPSSWAWPGLLILEAARSPPRRPPIPLWGGHRTV